MDAFSFLFFQILLPLFHFSNSATNTFLPLCTPLVFLAASLICSFTFHSRYFLARPYSRLFLFLGASRLRTVRADVRSAPGRRREAHSAFKFIESARSKCRGKKEKEKGNQSVGVADAINRIARPEQTPRSKLQFEVRNNRDD